MPSLDSFLRGAIRRLPVETVLVSSAALAVLLLIHGDYHHGDQGVWPLRVVLAAIIAGPLAFSLHELLPRATITGGAAISALSLLIVSLKVDSIDAAQRAEFAWTYGPLLLASYLVPFVVAARRFSTFVRRFFEELTTWGLLGAAANAAVGVLMYAMIALFGLDVIRFTFDTMLVLSAGILLIAVERLLPDRETQGKVPELWRRLATAIGAPFVCVLLAILALYEVRVLARGELPSNVLSPLIIGAGLVGFVCTLIISAVAAERVGTAAISPADPHPFLSAPSVRIARAFPVVLLLLLPMAGWALLVRVDQYGLTPFRVGRIATVGGLVVLSAWGSVRWWRGRSPLSWEVPSTIAVLAVLVAVGPLSAVNLSTRSLARSLEAQLANAGVHTREVADHDLPNLRLLPVGPWSELASTIETLADVAGDPGIRRVLHGATQDCSRRGSAEHCLQRLGISAPHLDNPSPAAAIATTKSASLRGPVAVPAGEATFLVTGAGQGEIVGDTIRLECTPAGWATGTLAPFVAAAERGDPLPATPVALDGISCASPGQLVVHEILVRSEATEPSEIMRLEALWIRPPH